MDSTAGSVTQGGGVREWRLRVSVSWCLVSTAEERGSALGITEINFSQITLLLWSFA